MKKRFRPKDGIFYVGKSVRMPRNRVTGARIGVADKDLPEFALLKFLIGSGSRSSKALNVIKVNFNLKSTKRFFFTFFLFSQSRKLLPAFGKLKCWKIIRYQNQIISPIFCRMRRFELKNLNPNLY
jgi:hypothetical protein